MYFKIFCPKQGQGFKRSATCLYPNSGRVISPPPPSPNNSSFSRQKTKWSSVKFNSFSTIFHFFSLAWAKFIIRLQLVGIVIVIVSWGTSSPNLRSSGSTAPWQNIVWLFWKIRIIVAFICLASKFVKVLPAFYASKFVKVLPAFYSVRVERPCRKLHLTLKPRVNDFGLMLVYSTYKLKFGGKDQKKKDQYWISL